MVINAFGLLGIYSISSFWHRCYSPSLTLMGFEAAVLHEHGGMALQIAAGWSCRRGMTRLLSFSRAPLTQGPESLAQVHPIFLLGFSLTHVHWALFGPWRRRAVGLQLARLLSLNLYSLRR